ncbi:putative DNA helicase [compost metagenome]
MYRRQKKLIEEEISRAEWAVSRRGSIKVDTVDSYQGQENEILLLSLVRNNPRGLQGFLVDQSRINVALSRAKKRLVVIGSLRMWNNESAPSALGKVVKFISEKHAQAPGDYEIVTGTDVIEGKNDE